MRANVHRLSKIFRLAGGRERAADILEQGIELGIEHLLPIDRVRVALMILIHLFGSICLGGMYGIWI